jgi:hypothetical protein
LIGVIEMETGFAAHAGAGLLHLLNQLAEFQPDTPARHLE